MTFTYNSSLISSSGLAFVRWRIQDTSTSDQLLQDDEITGAISVYGDKWAAAVASAKAIAFKYARRADMTMGKLSIKHSQKAKAFADLAAEIEEEAGLLVAASPWMGAESIGTKQTYEEDTDRVLPFFTRDTFDTPSLLPVSPSTGT